jgi:group I intron endonuclease
MKLNMKLVTFGSCAFNLCCIYYVGYIYPSAFNFNKTNTQGNPRGRAFSTDRDDSNKFKPAVVYTNADTQKMQIIKENKGRCGVYRWTNLLNGKSYVGSSVNLSIRLLQYFNTNYLLRNICMIICRAMLKHGYSNFSLTILEYCEPNKRLEREKYYINLFNPEYNYSTNPIAPFSGLKHSDETRKKMSEAKIGLQAGENNPFYGKNHSAETRKRLSETNSGENHPFYGKTHSDETLKKMSEANKRTMLGKKHSDEILRKMSEAQKGENNSMFGKNHSAEARKKMSDVKLGRARPEGSGRPSQRIEVVDNKNNHVTTYDSISAAARALDLPKSTIYKYLARNDQKPYKGQYTFKKV